MIVIVSDTSPLNYLTIIGQADVLHLLFDRVIIPPAVERELLHPAAPDIVRDWVQRRPEWLNVMAVDARRQHEVRQRARRLGAGEIEAICLAMEVSADYLLTDDRGARIEAERRYHLRVTGTLGVLDLAAARGLVRLPEVVARLRSTTLRMPETVLEALLRRDRERSRPSSDPGG